MRYEARVTSRVGPLVTSALPNAQALPRPAATLLTIVSPEPIPVADLLRGLDALGVRVNGVRCRRTRTKA
jgi:hypothetical protein